MFEQRAVATLLAYCLSSRQFLLPGSVSVVRMQQRHMGARYDDVVVTSENQQADEYTVEVQVRHRPDFNASDAAFVDLVRLAIESLDSHDDAFRARRRRLALLVDSDTPNARHFEALTDAAAATLDSVGFAAAMAAPGRHSQAVRRRWEQVLRAVKAARHHVNDVGIVELAWRVVANVNVVRWQLQGQTAEKRSEILNLLASLWSPPSSERGSTLLARLDSIAADLIPTGGEIGRAELWALLREDLAGADGSFRPGRRSLIADRRRRPVARIRARLRILGVPLAVAETLAATLANREPSVDLASLSPGAVVGICGDVGSGKSTLGDGLFREFVERFAQDQSVPIPVRLDANTVAGSLEAAVREEASGLGEPSSLGTTVILDSLDEVPERRAKALVFEAYALTSQWQSTSVILLSKPVRGMTDTADWRSIRLLDADESVVLVQQVAGVATLGTLWGYPVQIREAARRPLFAILLGVWLYQTDRQLPRSSADLVRHLVERALDRLTDLEPVARQLLRQLALASLTTGSQTVSLADVPGGLDHRAVLQQTRLVQIDTQQRVAFSLALLTDWFAAEHLLVMPTAVEDIVSDPETLNRWRYAIATAVSQAPYARGTQILQPIASEAPAICGWIIDQATSHTWTPPDQGIEEKELGRRLSECMQRWADALGQLTPLVIPTRDGRAVQPLGVRKSLGRVYTAWYIGTDQLPSVVDLPADVHPFADLDRPWTGQAMEPEGRDEAWPWRWTWERIRRGIADLLRHAALLSTSEVLRYEADWALAQVIIGRHPTPVYVTPIPLTSIEEAAAALRRLGGFSMQTPAGTWPLADADQLIARLKARGDDVIRPAWEPPNRSGALTWSFWSAEALMRRARDVTRGALDAYDEIVAAWFPTFQSQLRTASLTRGKVIGVIEVGSRGSNRRPTVRWHIEPVARSTDAQDEWRLMSADESADDEKRVIERLKASPVARRGIVIHGDMPALWSTRPAAVLMTDLLWNDLHEWKWTEGASPRDL